MTTAEVSAAQPSLWAGIKNRQLQHYPRTAPRVAQLLLVVIITIALYYQLYVVGSVSTLLLPDLGMSFKFFVWTLAFGNLFGAFASLAAGLADRVGRTQLVVGGLLITAVLTAFVIPETTSKWPFAIASWAVAAVEGVVLVATPALVRDFSPQVGRASAMGFWTMGPVLGSLAVSLVATNVIHTDTTWPTLYRICGIVGLVVFVAAFLFLRELSPGIRDQLMVSERDRILIEARAKGIDIEESLRRPFRQLIKPDIAVSALAVSVLLLVYYTAVGFGTILYQTIFGFSLKDANGLGGFTLAGRSFVLDGRDQVAALYQHWTDTDQSVFYVEDEIVAVGDHVVMGRGISYQQTLGSELAAGGIDADPDAMYLTKSAITMIWPYDDRCRLLGEEVWEFDPSVREYIKLDPADVLSAEQAGQLLDPLIKALPRLDESLLPRAAGVEA